MKTTGLANQSRRPHNFRTTKVITSQLVSHILKIRQAEPMYGKEKIKRELEKDNVLPPRSPKMNCYVERANETYRYEFWNVYEIPDTIEETRKLLRKFEYKYNCERMHQSLNYLTPMEYYYKLKENCA